VDGLDLLVGTVVSGGVAGLGAVVAAMLGSVMSRNTLMLSVIAWVTGGIFIYGAYAMLSGVPEKSDLIALEPNVVHEAYVDESLNGDLLRLYDAFGRCITISPRKDYYPQLVDAINASKNYRVLYARESTMFSSAEEFYPVIYDVSVNGQTLESFEIRVNQMTLLCYGAFAFGLVMFIGGFFAPRLATSPSRLRQSQASA